MIEIIIYKGRIYIQPTPEIDEMFRKVGIAPDLLIVTPKLWELCKKLLTPEQIHRIEADNDESSVYL